MEMFKIFRKYDGWDVTVILENMFKILACFLYSDSGDGGDRLLLNVGLFFLRLHCVIYQKIEHFVSTGVRTSNPI
jgi:hypothetical protein